MAENTELSKDPLKPPSRFSKEIEDLVFEVAKNSVREAAGIGTHEKEVTKKGFGRTMYAVRDFLQGTWWVFVLFAGCMGITLIVLLWLKKLLGV